MTHYPGLVFRWWSIVMSLLGCLKHVWEWMRKCCVLLSGLCSSTGEPHLSSR